MPLTNPSQLLIRNIDLLNATQALLVNPPEDSLVDQYISNYPAVNITCLNYNYSAHKYYKNHKKISSYFAASYQSIIKHDLVILFFPKSKKEFTYTLTMLANHLAENAKVILIGENNGGVKSSAKLSKNFLIYCNKIDSARHCSLYMGEFNGTTNNFSIDDWYKNYSFTLNNIKLTISSLPGVFSQNELDIGTKLLLNNLPKRITGEVLDFGCGAGVISAYIGKKHPTAKINLLDVNALALTSAKQTLAINNLRGYVFASDSLSNVGAKYQHVVSNPPFHQGLKTNYAATESFLSGIKVQLRKGGTVTIVANNFLHYQEIMQNYIGKTTQLINYKGFSVYQSQ